MKTKNILLEDITMNLKNNFSQVLVFAGLISAIVCISLVSLTCMYNNPVDPLDPSVKPEILSTYPANGTIGLFDLNSPWNSYRYHFSIRFNKLMDRGSFTENSISCNGFGTKVLIQPCYSGTENLYGDVVSFIIYDTTLGWWRTAVYQIGKKYTITLDTTVTDFNNNHLVSPYSFSFTPEPYFRILASFPSSGDTLPSSSGISLYFNSPIDSSLLPYLSLAPSADINWSCPSYGSGGYQLFSSGFGLRANRLYTFKVAQGAKDIQANILSRAFATSFFTGGFVVRYFENYNYYLNSKVYVQCSSLIDTSAAKKAFQISPSTTGRFQWVSNGSGFEFYPENDWIPETKYTFTISTLMRDVDGDTLSSIITRTTMYPSFQVVESHYGRTPYGLDSTSLYVFFSGRIDINTISSGITINPAVPGKFNLERDGTVFSFHPDDSRIRPFTTYSVALDRSIHSIAGYPLAYPDTVTFTTGVIVPFR